MHRYMSAPFLQNSQKNDMIEIAWKKKDCRLTKIYKNLYHYWTSLKCHKNEIPQNAVFMVP